ncbi:MAG: class I SAM-dependent methyltransferase [Candidatus Wildermuthbacteria bacterium]|nr:class I SAM-dependent methyltransferase [Candidatus Wildermuthbacteria bacterium]
MRIQYRYPKLYQLFVHKLFYPKQLWEKLRLETGENNTIFEVAAGYGYASTFLHPSNSYYGIDLNKHFIAYGRKKGTHIELKSIFDPAAYRVSDVFLAIDIVHHLSAEKLKDVFNLIFQHSKKKVIVIDPAFVSIARKYGMLGTFLGWLFRFFDNDGFTKIERWLSEEEYQNLFRSRFSSEYGENFEVTLQKVSGYHFVVFTRKIYGTH